MDSQPLLKYLKSDAIPDRSKRLELRHYKTRDAYANGEFGIEWRPREQQTGDAFTHPVQGKQEWQRRLKEIGLRELDWEIYGKQEKSADQATRVGC